MIAALVLLATLCASAPAPTVSALVDENAVRRGIDPLLVRTLIRHESAGNPRAIGYARRRDASGRRVPKDFGLMQLRIGAATRGLKLPRSALFDPSVNVFFGVWYLADKLAECPTLHAALGAYSSGRCHVNGYARRLVREYRKAQRTERRTWSLKGRAA